MKPVALPCRWCFKHTSLVQLLLVCHYCFVKIFAGSKVTKQINKPLYDLFGHIDDKIE